MPSEIFHRPSLLFPFSRFAFRIPDDGRRNERRGQKLMTEERQLIPARAYRGEARQSGFLARRDQSISRTFDKPPFRFSNKALLLPRVQKVGRERKKIRLSFGHPANFLPPFRFFIPPSVDRISTFIPRGDANDRPGPLHCSETLENFRSGVSTSSRKTSSSSK